MAAAMSSTTNEEPTCPICIGRLKVPRTLTCLHTFCQHCLTSYIVTSDYTVGEKPCLNCPVCRTPTYPSAAERKEPKEWASLFPQNATLLAILGEEKAKVDYLCDPCSSEEHSIIAMGFCVECREYLCESCINSHKRVRAVKSHRVLTIDELSKTPDVIMNLNVSSNCIIHEDKEIEYFCKDHKTVCCVKCSIIDHRSCNELVDLKSSAKSALDEDPQDIIEMLKRIEEFVMNHIQANKSNVKRLETQTSEIVSTIKNAREQVNKLFDVIENEVEQKGRQIYKEEVIKWNDQNQQCQSLLAAVQGSRQLLGAILRLGNETQVFLTARQIKTQLANYREQVLKKYTAMESMEITLTLHDSLKTLMSLAADQLATVQTKVNVARISFARIFRTPTLASVIATQCPKSKTGSSYIDSVWLHDDSILRIDYNQRTCCLYSPEHKHISDYEPTSRPWNGCLVGDVEVAVTVPFQNIQFLACTAPITPTRSFTTRHQCSGIAALSGDKLVISGYNNPGNGNYYWSIVTTQGKEEHYHEIDQKGNSWTCLAVSESKTRLYMSCYHANTVYCFGLDGQLHFVYKSENLIEPLGIGVDRDDNIYVVGCGSNNIHQLLPDGNLIQIIDNKISKSLCKLTFDKRRDRMFLSSNSCVLHIFVLK